MSKSRTPKPSYVLTEQGLNKFKEALKKIFDKTYEELTDTTIADKTSKYRSTIAKIRTGSAGVNLNTLEEVFNSLNNNEELDNNKKPKIVLDDGDYQEFNRLSTPSRRKSSQTSPNKEDFILLTSDSEKLKNALWKLDYSKQQNLFYDAIS